MCAQWSFQFLLQYLPFVVDINLGHPGIAMNKNIFQEIQQAPNDFLINFYSELSLNEEFIGKIKARNAEKFFWFPIQESCAPPRLLCLYYSLKAPSVYPHFPKASNSRKGWKNFTEKSENTEPKQFCNQHKSGVIKLPSEDTQYTFWLNHSRGNKGKSFWAFDEATFTINSNGLPSNCSCWCFIVLRFFIPNSDVKLVEKFFSISISQPQPSTLEEEFKARWTSVLWIIRLLWSESSKQPSKYLINKPKSSKAKSFELRKYFMVCLWSWSKINILASFLNCLRPSQSIKDFT